MPEQPFLLSRTDTYLVRIWRDPSRGRPWRIWVLHTPTGQQGVFLDLRGLFLFIQQHQMAAGDEVVERGHLR